MRILVLSLAIVCAGIGLAAETPTTSADRYASIEKLLDSANPAEQRNGAAAIAGLLKESDAATSLDMCRRFVAHWQERLLRQHLNDDFLALSRLIVLAHPELSAEVEALYRQRITVLLNAGRNDEALSDAKSLYNVSTLDTLESNALVVRAALRATRAENSDIVRRFKLEQIVEADGSENQNPQGKHETALASIKIDSKEYDESIKNAPTTSATDLLALGNLLLLIDLTGDAIRVFDRAYKLAPKEQRDVFVERLAAAHKAESGSPLRAREWLAQAKESLKMPVAKAKSKPKAADGDAEEDPTEKPETDPNAPPKLPEYIKR